MVVQSARLLNIPGVWGLERVWASEGAPKTRREDPKTGLGCRV